VVGVACDGVAVFVGEGVVASAEKESVVDIGAAAVFPPVLVVEVDDPAAAAGEAAVASVSYLGGSLLGGGPGAGFAAECERFAGGRVVVGDDRTVTGDPFGFGAWLGGAVEEGGASVGKGDDVGGVTLCAAPVAVAVVSYGAAGDAGQVDEGVGSAAGYMLGKGGDFS
jgi:hypothetical protein